MKIIEEESILTLDKFAKDVAILMAKHLDKKPYELSEIVKQLIIISCHCTFEGIGADEGRKSLIEMINQCWEIQIQQK